MFGPKRQRAIEKEETQKLSGNCNYCISFFFNSHFSCMGCIQMHKETIISIAKVMQMFQFPIASIRCYNKSLHQWNQIKMKIIINTCYMNNYMSPIVHGCAYGGLENYTENLIFLVLSTSYHTIKFANIDPSYANSVRALSYPCNYNVCAQSGDSIYCLMPFTPLFQYIEQQQRPYINIMAHFHWLWHPK